MDKALKEHRHLVAEYNRRAAAAAAAVAAQDEEEEEQDLEDDLEDDSVVDELDDVGQSDNDDSTTVLDLVSFSTFRLSL
jgi:hypothetical protein